MNDKFDELAKAMAQPIARRAALKKFGIGMGLFALAALGLPNNAQADKGGKPLPGYGEFCRTDKGCQPQPGLGGVVCCPQERGGKYGICTYLINCGYGV